MAPAVDVAGAIAQVRAHGAARDRALLKVLLREELSDEDLSAVTAMQNPDGGFKAAEVAGDRSVIGQTAAAVIHLCALGAEEFGTTQAAADFLLHQQRADGRWGESELLAAFNPPPYFEPSSEDVEAWETAAACVALCALGLPLDHRQATAWLAKRPCMRGEPARFAFEAPLLYALFRRVEGPSPHVHDAARRAAHAVNLEKADTWTLLFSVEAMRLMGIQGTDLTVQAYCEALEARQRPDRGFSDGGVFDGTISVHALAALDLAGRIALEKRPPREDDEPDLADAARAL